MTFVEGRPVKVIEERYGKTTTTIVDYSQTNSLANGAPLVKKLKMVFKPAKGEAVE